MTNLSTLEYVENFTVSKSLNDRMWKLEFTLDKDDAPTPMIGIRAFATDYADVEHCLFVGFVPGADYIRQNTNNKVSITAFDFSWYLSAQYVEKIYWEIDWNDLNDDDLVAVMCGEASDLNITGVKCPTSFVPGCPNPGTWIWSHKTTKMEAIEELCEKCDKMFWVWFKNEGGGVYICQAYYLPYTFIDGQLPGMATFTNPSDYVIDSTIKKNSLEDYNRVSVYGTDPETGDWYTKTYETAAVTAMEEKPIEYVFEDAKLTTQAKVDAKALALYDILNGISSDTYSVTLTKRYDLRLLQKVKFVNYTDIPEVDMRIIEISYQRYLNNDTVIIKFTKDQTFANMRLIARYLENDPVQQQQQVISDKMNTRLAHLSIGTVTDISGNIVTVTLERSGNSVEARIV